MWSQVGHRKHHYEQSVCLQCRRPGFDPGLGRYSGEGNGNPLQYSCLQNPWTEETGGLQSMGLQRVRHDWATSLLLHFSGGDGIPTELFQILNNDVVKVLHSICQQIWKTQQWPQGWKRSVFIPIPKKGKAKECSNYHAIALISHASKVILKILQARLQ